MLTVEEAYKEPSFSKRNQKAELVVKALLDGEKLPNYYIRKKNQCWINDYDDDAFSNCSLWSDNVKDIDNDNDDYDEDMTHSIPILSSYYLNSVHIFRWWLIICLSFIWWAVVDAVCVCVHLYIKTYHHSIPLCLEGCWVGNETKLL